MLALCKSRRQKSYSIPNTSKIDVFFNHSELMTEQQLILASAIWYNRISKIKTFLLENPDYPQKYRLIKIGVVLTGRGICALKMANQKPHYNKFILGGYIPENAPDFNPSPKEYILPDRLIPYNGAYTTEYWTNFT